MPTYDANGNLLINTNASTVAQSVSAPALTKGSQAATGFSTQDLKDSGRTQITLYVDSVSGITTEALATLNITKGDAAQSTATSYTVTAGKTFSSSVTHVECYGPIHDGLCLACAITDGGVKYCGHVPCFSSCRRGDARDGIFRKQRGSSDTGWLRDRRWKSGRHLTY